MNKLIAVIVFVFFSCGKKEVNPTCIQLEKIITNQEFLKHFRLCEREEAIISIYNSGEGDDKTLVCEGFDLPCGKPVYFDKADFEIKINETPKVLYPRITYFKKGNKYQFFVSLEML